MRQIIKQQKAVNPLEVIAKSNVRLRVGTADTPKFLTYGHEPYDASKTNQSNMMQDGRWHVGPTSNRLDFTLLDGLDTPYRLECLETWQSEFRMLFKGGRGDYVGINIYPDFQKIPKAFNYENMSVKFLHEKFGGR
ncbi:hypothetical protein HYS31_00065 [Candidatus Woesearchaeota archaeon]|nr:hypothetical protein [Candidatus Woesearchaeota archaeon]